MILLLLSYIIHTSKSSARQIKRLRAQWSGILKFFGHKKNSLNDFIGNYFPIPVKNKSSKKTPLKEP